MATATLSAHVALVIGEGAHEVQRVAQQLHDDVGRHVELQHLTLGVEERVAEWSVRSLSSSNVYAPLCASRTSRKSAMLQSLNDASLALI